MRRNSEVLWYRKKTLELWLKDEGFACVVIVSESLNFAVSLHLKLKILIPLKIIIK